ncbi:MAG TPA: hypothetical protein VGG45_15475 [Terracidiphilus sp.]
MPGTIESRHTFPQTPESRTQEIRAYLARLLAGPQFSAASRRGQLLRFLVDHTLAGDADKINEYAIGLEVFERPASFDPRIESVVRTEFSRLRQRLRDYYAEDGLRDTIVIEFPPRSYVASFTFRDASKLRDPIAFPEPARAPETAPPSASHARRIWLIGAIAVPCIAAGVAGVMLWRQHVSNLVARQPIDAIVVLPFADYSPGHQDEYIADGITEELTNDLAQWRDLRVVARTSAFAFKDKGEDVREIGRQLNVDAVLEGSFTREGDRMRVTAQLNRAMDGYHLWSHSYETQSNDTLAMQDAVATSISDAIGRIRGGSPPAIHEPTGNAEAMDLYLQGEYQYYLRTRDSLVKSISLFQAALQKDPNFARAWLGIGHAEIASVSMTVTTQNDGFPRVRDAAQKAIQLDPDLPDAYELLADATYNWDWNWPEAEKEYRHAIELGGGAETHARYAWSLATRGRFAEAHAQVRLAAQQDPLSVVPPFEEFVAYYFERNQAGQQKAVQRMEQINPQFFGGPGWALVGAMARHDCGTVVKDVPLFVKAFPKLPLTQTMLAFDAVCKNDRAGALREIKQMNVQRTPHYQLAIVYAFLHDTDNAIGELEKCADQHEGQILYIKYDPFFDGIRNDPRYVALEKRVGLE